MKRTNFARKGFTLVELLIVMVIIGTLASTLMLTMGGGMGKAEATKIVSDLRNLKAAAIMYYTDNGVWPGDTGSGAWQWITQSLDRYLDRDYPDDTQINYYAIKDSNSRVFVGHGEITDPATKKALEAMAADAALYGTGSVSAPESNDITTPSYYNGQDYIWMLVTR